MDLQKINVKVFARDEGEPPLADFIPVFHSWIQETEGAYHDVADYSHIVGGPGVLLVAHDSNISIDEQGGRRGLLFNQKRSVAGGSRERLRNALKRTLAGCQQLEEEKALGGKLAFRGNEVMIVLNDRLRAPNNGRTLEELSEDLRAIGTVLFGSGEFALRHVDDPDQRFTVHLESPLELSVSRLLANVRRG